MRIEELDLEKAGIRYNKTLNPNVWVDYQLDSNIRKGLLRIAKKFIEFLNMPDLDVEDIVLTGSMANYNYTKFSDFDLHVITDYKKLKCDNLTDELFRAKKGLWNSEHDITILDHDVELYVEDSNKPPVAQGIYSLLNNKWLKKPEFNPPKYDDDAVDAKASAIMMDIDRLIDSHSDDETEYQRLSDKISKMRQSGLDKAGEFSTENLAFKILRNLGYLNKLRNTKFKIVDRSLSLP